MIKQDETGPFHLLKLMLNALLIVSIRRAVSWPNPMQQRESIKGTDDRTKQREDFKLLIKKKGQLRKEMQNKSKNKII